MDWAFQAFPIEMGFDLDEVKVSYLAFANDLVLLASSLAGKRWLFLGEISWSASGPTFMLYQSELFLRATREKEHY